MSPRLRARAISLALALPRLAAAADIDGDGVDDLVLRYPGAADHVPVLVSAEGGWIVQDREVPALTGPSVAARTVMGDFDGDGRIDLARVRPGAWLDGELLRDLGGTKWEVSSFGLPAVSAGAEPLAADVDGDGATDLVFTEPGSGLGALTVLFSARDGTFDATTEPAPAWIHDRGAVVFAADIDGDGDDDLVSHRPEGAQEKLYVLASEGGSGWTDRSAVAPAWVNARGATAAVGDFDGDGDDDLAFAPADGAKVLPVLLSRGDGTFIPSEPLVPASATAGGRFPLAGDFDGDGLTDLVMLGGDDGSVLPVLLANGDGTWTAREHPCPAACAATRDLPPGVGDFDADGRSDLAFAFGDDDGDGAADAGEAPFPVLYSRGYEGWSAGAWSLRPELAALVEGAELVAAGGPRLRHTVSAGSDGAYDPSPADRAAFDAAFEAMAQGLASSPPAPGPIVVLPPPADVDGLLDAIGLTGVYHGTLYSGATTARAVLALRDVGGVARGSLYVTEETLAFDGGLCGTEVLPAVALPVNLTTSGPTYPGLFPQLAPRSTFAAWGGTTRDASLRFVVSGDTTLSFAMTLDNGWGGASAASTLYGAVSVDTPSPCDDLQVNFLFERHNAELVDTFFP